MEPEKRELAKALRFFVGRSDRFNQQKDDGSYEAIKRELNDSYLLAHCRGDITVSSHTTNDLGNTPIAMLDFDSKEKNDPDILKQQIDAIKSSGIIHWCQRWLAHHEIPSFIEFSGRKGFHLWVVFKKYCPSEKSQRLLHVMIGDWLKDNSLSDSFNIEYNPKQTGSRSFDEPGSSVKLPWGKHRVTGNWTPFVNGDFTPLADWGLAELNSAPPIDEMMLDAILAEYPDPSPPPKQQKQQATLTKTRPLSPEIEGAALEKLFECAFLRHCRDNATSLERDRWFTMISLLTTLGEKAYPLIHDLSKPYPGYSENETEKYIQNAVKDAGKKPAATHHTCHHIQTKLGFSCPDNCSAKTMEGIGTPIGMAQRLARQDAAMERTNSITVKTNRNGKQEITVNCPRLAEEIKDRHLFKTFRDTEEVLYYSQGVYLKNGESLIKEEVSNVLGDLTKRYHTLEVVHYVKTTTYANREDFDADPFVLNVQNGLLDLRTMSLNPHTPSFLSTIRIPVKYDPYADCLVCRQFFSEVLEPEDVPLMEEIFGYCLDPLYRFHKAFLFLGEGANGKTTMLTLLRTFLGYENCAGVTLQDLDFNRFASSYLWAKLANLCDELPQDTIKHAGKFKTLTGGGVVAAEHKFQAQFSFKNRAKLIFVCNKPPEVQNEDSFAFWRRWSLINFPNQFIGTQADPKLMEKLTTEKELSGLFNMALAALKRLWDTGQFSHSLSADDVAQQYMRAANPIFGFMHSCCELGVDAWTPTDDLYSSYVSYCKRNNIPVLGKESFGRKLNNTPEAKDVKSERRRKEGGVHRGWRGIRLVIVPLDMQPDDVVETTKPELEF